MDPEGDRNPANDRLARTLNWIGLSAGFGLLWFAFKVGNV